MTRRAERPRSSPTASPSWPPTSSRSTCVVLDLHGVIGYTDFFVICSGNTDRQTKAIHDGIHQGMKQDHGVLPRRVEGLSEARWILMDYLDVIVHVFTPDARDYYRLEQLWGEAPAARGRRSERPRPPSRAASMAMELRGLEPLTFWLPARRSPS